MMYSKQEKQKLQLIAAAVLLGIFSLNPMAQAFDLQPPMLVDNSVPMPSYEPPRFTRQELGEITIKKSEDRVSSKGDRLEVREPRELRADRSPAMEPAERVEVIAQEEKDGMSLNEINRILREPLQVKPNEKNTNVAFLGDVPSRCVFNAKGEMTASIDYDKANSKDGQHVFRVHMPLCENIPNFKKIPGEKMVKVSEIPGARQMNDVKGKIVLASGFKDSDSSPNIEELKNKGEVVVLETEKLQRDAEKAAEIAAARQNQDKADEQSKVDKVAQIAKDKKLASIEFDKQIKTAEGACNEKDFDKIEKSMGNYPDLKEHVVVAARGSLLKDIREAGSAEDASAAWDAFSEASDRFSWEDDVINKGKNAYIEKRFSLINASMGSDDDEKKSAASEAEKMADDWAKDFKDMDSRLFNKQVNKDKFAMLYGNLAASAANGSMKNARSISKAVASAEKNYNKAKLYSNGADKTRVEGALSKINAQAFMACIKADPTNMVACESKYREKVGAHGEKYAAGLKKQADGGDEEAAAEVQAFAQDYLRADGYGMTANYQGFGTVHQMPGAFEQAKVQTLQEMQQRMMQQQQQQMMQRMYGGMGGMQGGMQQRTSFFGF
jgi:hypothetical protein